MDKMLRKFHVRENLLRGVPSEAPGSKMKNYCPRASNINVSPEFKETSDVSAWA